MRTLTIALGVWAAIGPLIGILVGHYLTRAWQREQWLIDNRKEECRELLSTLTTSYWILSRLDTLSTSPSEEESQKRLSDAELDSYRTIEDRIFIAADLKKAGVLKTWDMAVNAFSRDRDADHLMAAFRTIRRLIIAIATDSRKDMS